jgi:hypothetical protein
MGFRCGSLRKSNFLVIEQLVRPFSLPRFAKQLLRPGGHLIISTSYHGYLKNLILALTNRWDAHLNPFWDGGHIKFWSCKTLSQLLNETVSASFGSSERVDYLSFGRA